MRLMSYVRLRAKTGLYEYRRVVPPHLRALVSQVQGFAEKPGRTEFTQSLGTSSKAEANRQAAMLDQRVQAALDAAEVRLARRPSATGNVGVAPVVVDPASVFSAVEAWKRQEVIEAERAAFNGLPYLTVGDDVLGQSDFRYHLQQFSQYSIGNDGALAALHGFDDVLLAALSSQGILLDRAHPVIEKLRPTFAKAWWELIVAKDAMANRRWDYAPATDAAASLPASSTPSHSAALTTSLGETGTPLLSLLADWKAQAGMGSRQLNTYVADITAFASYHPGLTVEAVRRTHAQKWIGSLTENSPKTIQRKLASLRNNWGCVNAFLFHEHDAVRP